MNHQNSREGSQYFITRLTNLLFVLVMLYPILESIFLLALNTEPNEFENKFKGETLRTYLPYFLALWLYYYSAHKNLTKSNLALLQPDDEKGRLIYGWLAEIGVGDVAVHVADENKISSYAFGTKRHKYITITQAALDGLADDELRALLTHEAGHHYFGDVWKFTLARALTVSILVARLIVTVSGMSSTNRINESGVGTLLYFLPAFLGFFAYAIMSTGLLAITRLRELTADSYALSKMGDDSAYKRLSAKIYFFALKYPSVKARFHVPDMFRFHPIGRKRGLLSREKPDDYISDIIFAFAFMGLLLGALIGIHGLIEMSILLTLPLVFILGSPALYSISGSLNSIKRSLGIIFSFTGAASLTVLLLTLPWSIVRYSGPQSISNYVSSQMTIKYYFAPVRTIRNDFYQLFDNYMLTFIAGGLLLLLFLYGTEKIKQMSKEISIAKIKLRSILVFALWAVLSLTMIYYWVDAFGPFPVVRYLLPYVNGG